MRCKNKQENEKQYKYDVIIRDGIGIVKRKIDLRERKKNEKKSLKQ